MCTISKPCNPNQKLIWAIASILCLTCLIACGTLCRMLCQKSFRKFGVFLFSSHALCLLALNVKIWSISRVCLCYLINPHSLPNVYYNWRSTWMTGCDDGLTMSNDSNSMKCIVFLCWVNLCYRLHDCFINLIHVVSIFNNSTYLW